MKIAFVVAAAVLTTVPLVTPAKAQGVEMAQVDMRTGLHLDDPAQYSRDRRRYNSSATVGVGPGGVTIGPRQRCRMETATISLVRPRVHREMFSVLPFVCAILAFARESTGPAS
jgi:hypothetical protein